VRVEQERGRAPGPPGARRAAPAALLALAVALAAAAPYSGGCAATGHAAPDLGEAPGDVDGGYAGAAAPGPLNTALISDTSLCAGGAATVDWSPMRRISRVEYDNMVRDLLGDTTQPATAFVPESPLAAGVNFDANTYTSVSSLIVQQYQQAAETLAQATVADASRLSGVLPCQTHDDACAQQFIASFADRAFRGQLDSAESAGLFQVYSAVKAQFDFAAGIQAVIIAVLESPRFLYVLEFGGGSPSGAVVALSPYEVAARLALALWRSVPDDALMAAAAAGQLSTADQVEAQAARMLGQTTKAQGAVDDFTTQWMQLQSTPTLGKDHQFAAWTGNPKLGTEMRDEVLADVSQLVLTENGGLTELLTSPSSYLNGDLASFYQVAQGGGAPFVVDDAALQGATSFFKADLTPAGRAGILTSGGVMATQAHTTLPSSVLRGKLVREQVLCDEIPAPPPNVPPPPAGVVDGGTTRSLFEAHATMPGCVNCHQYMDPIGYGFGHFDATGAYQTLDANGFGTGPALDVTGQVEAMPPETFTATFDGAADLVKKLASAPQVQQCFALQELRYALGRIETRADACSAQQIFASFATSQLNVQKLLIAIVRSDAFRYRSVATPGSACR
jgi:Protein of unknown function (DUF1592)/Protein of unknown function (DUF1588)/Protein of unknown function (DUF1595)/Protein of unknown function (DUF1585)/Protein of unknown function (DUF1587)